MTNMQGTTDFNTMDYRALIPTLEGIPGFANLPDLGGDPLRHVLSHRLASLDGLWLEFGVYSGTTLTAMAHHAGVDRMVFGFDSFEGLPENWLPNFDKGCFSTGGRFPKVPDNAVLIKGWFDQSLPRFTKAFSGPVSLLHVDCDLYSSTKTVFTCLSAQLVRGTVIVFDEIFNYPGYLEHEFKAFAEFMATRPDLGWQPIGVNGAYRHNMNDDWTRQKLAIRLV